jgi:hypothetical protein
LQPACLAILFIAGIYTSGKGSSAVGLTALLDWTSCCLHCCCCRHLHQRQGQHSAAFSLTILRCMCVLILSIAGIYTSGNGSILLHSL